MDSYVIVDLCSGDRGWGLLCLHLGNVAPEICNDFYSENTHFFLSRILISGSALSFTYVQQLKAFLGEARYCAFKTSKPNVNKNFKAAITITTITKLSHLTQSAFPQFVHFGSI